MGPNPPDRDVADNVENLLWAANLTATDVEIKAIAAALSDWERKIREGARSRPRGKAARSQAQIAQHERQMQAVRDRIRPRCTGVKEQTVTARIIDPGLRELLGPEISLNFNTEAWVPARFRGDDVVEYIRGEYQAMQGHQVEAPLLVKFKEGQGTVIFTSFHNEAQNSRQEEGLLKYLVFSAVTAREQEVADKAMLSGGFSPAKRSLISHSSGQPSVTKTYNSPRSGPLRFSLSFAGQGARHQAHPRRPHRRGVREGGPGHARRRGRRRHRRRVAIHRHGPPGPSRELPLQRQRGRGDRAVGPPPAGPIATGLRTLALNPWPVSLAEASTIPFSPTAGIFPGEFI